MENEIQEMGTELLGIMISDKEIIEIRDKYMANWRVDNPTYFEGDYLSGVNDGLFLMIKVLKSKKNQIWDGSSDLANKIFGECYDIDWNYVSKESSDIIVGSTLIKVGDEIMAISHSVKNKTEALIESKQAILTKNGIYAGFPSSYGYDNILKAMDEYYNQSK